MFLVGFIKTNHAKHLKNLSQSTVAAGMGGIMGNKGGCQLSFKLYEYQYNVINVHLVHGAKRFMKRDEMMSEIIRKMRIQRDEIDPDIISDFNFILGDMNYRLEGTFEELEPQIDKIVSMRKDRDQLYKSMNFHGKYPDYKEYDINFKPSYKRNKNEPGYFNKKSQAPSYTDRILLKNNTTNEIILNSYRCLDNVYGSDHRPIQLDVNILMKPLMYYQMPQLMLP